VSSNTFQQTDSSRPITQRPIKYVSTPEGVVIDIMYSEIERSRPSQQRPLTIRIAAPTSSVIYEMHNEDRSTAIPKSLSIPTFRIETPLSFVKYEIQQSDRSSKARLVKYIKYSLQMIGSVVATVFASADRSRPIPYEIRKMIKYTLNIAGAIFSLKDYDTSTAAPLPTSLKYVLNYVSPGIVNEIRQTESSRRVPPTPTTYRLEFVQAAEAVFEQQDQASLVELESMLVIVKDVVTAVSQQLVNVLTTERATSKDNVTYRSIQDSDTSKGIDALLKLAEETANFLEQVYYRYFAFREVYAFIEQVTQKIMEGITDTSMLIESGRSIIEQTDEAAVDQTQNLIIPSEQTATLGERANKEMFERSVFSLTDKGIVQIEELDRATALEVSSISLYDHETAQYSSIANKDMYEIETSRYITLYRMSVLSRDAFAASDSSQLTIPQEQIGIGIDTNVYHKQSQDQATFVDQGVVDIVLSDSASSSESTGREFGSTESIYVFEITNKDMYESDSAVLSSRESVVHELSDSGLESANQASIVSETDISSSSDYVTYHALLLQDLGTGIDALLKQDTQESTLVDQVSQREFKLIQGTFTLDMVTLRRFYIQDLVHGIDAIYKESSDAAKLWELYGIPYLIDTDTSNLLELVNFRYITNDEVGTGIDAFYRESSDQGHLDDTKPPKVIVTEYERRRARMYAQIILSLKDLGAGCDCLAKIDTELGQFTDNATVIVPDRDISLMKDYVHWRMMQEQEIGKGIDARYKSPVDVGVGVDQGIVEINRTDQGQLIDVNSYKEVTETDVAHFYDSEQADIGHLFSRFGLAKIPYNFISLPYPKALKTFANAILKYVKLLDNCDIREGAVITAKCINSMITLAINIVVYLPLLVIGQIDVVLPSDYKFLDKLNELFAYAISEVRVFKD